MNVIEQKCLSNVKRKSKNIVKRENWEELYSRMYKLWLQTFFFPSYNGELTKFCKWNHEATTY